MIRVKIVLVIIWSIILTDLHSQAPGNLKVYSGSCTPGNEFTGWKADAQPYFYYEFPGPFSAAQVFVSDAPYGGTYSVSFEYNNSNPCNQWPYALPSGRYTWNVRVYYQSMPSMSWIWSSETWGADFYVDVTAPNPPVISETHCGGSHTEWPAWTSHASPYFSWSNPGDAHSGVSYYQVASAKLPGVPGEWTTVASPYEPVIEGQYVFYFRSVDNAGNASSSYVMYVRIDNTAPPAPSVTETHCLPHGVWTAHTSPYFGWPAVLDASYPYSSGVSYYQASVNEGEWITVSSPWEPVYGTGQYNFRFRAVDGVGLAGSIDAVAGIYIDDSAPDAPVVTEHHCGGSTSIDPPWSSHTSPYFTWDIPYDAGSGINGFQVSVNGGEWAAASSGWEPELTPGSYTFDFRSVDKVGHTSTSNRLYVRIHIPLTIYVDADATGSDNGSSWENAFSSLQSALSSAIAGDVLWVASGIYKPSADKTGNSSPADPRSKTFQLVSDVAVYGGFDGTETALNERDISASTTVLSGDIGIPDDNADNCYSVITGVNCSYLDGFVITDGNGNGTVSLETDLGGGLRNYLINDFTAKNCIFIDNFSKMGGANGNYYCTGILIFENCMFVNNGGYNGGAMGNYNNKTYIRNCTFFGNTASSENSYGAAIFNWGSGSTAEITNCTFHNNIDVTLRGAIHNRGVTSSLTNCIIWGNNSNDIVNSNPGGGCTVTFSCIEQAGYAGSNGNISADPLFIDAGNGDLHLSPSSPCIDAGNGDAAPEFDLDGNARFDHPEVLNTGAGEPDYSDMGAYECLLTTHTEHFSNDQLKIFPNPSSGVFTVEGADIRQIEIFNISGISVFRMDNNITGQINPGKLPKGMYIIKIRTAGNIYLEKVIIK